MNRKILGRILVLVGVSMWAPYFVLKLSGEEVVVLPFLALHLAGVIPGALLVRGETLVRTLSRWLERGSDDQPIV
jgi:hypothetical protein